MPRAIIAALLIVTSVYMLVAFAALGAQDWRVRGSRGRACPDPRRRHRSHRWSTILAAGAVISIFSVTLVTMYGQTRILFAMGRDGLLPSMFAKVNPKSMTPVNNTIIVAIVVGLLAAFIPLDYLIDMVSIGTLTAFIVVSIGVIILRVREPDLPRGFKVPGYPVTPVLSVLACGYILYSLHWYTWIAFGGWVAIVLVYYMLWGRHHSALNDGGDGVIASAAPGVDDVKIVTPRTSRDSHRRIPVGQGRHLRPAPRGGSRQDAQAPRCRSSPSSRSHGRRCLPRASTRSTRSTRTSSPPTQRLRPRSVSRSWTPTSRSASTSTHTGRRPAVCMDAAKELGAEALVLGSSADGSLGQVVVGSTADRLLHSSTVPLAISPRGYRGSKSHGLTRITVCLSGYAGVVARGRADCRIRGAALGASASHHLRCAGAHDVSTRGWSRRRDVDPADLGTRRREKRWPS